MINNNRELFHLKLLSNVRNEELLSNYLAPSVKELINTEQKLYAKNDEYYEALMKV